jgi:nuclear transport factor 2 (NTF2) superfamily protein
MFRIIPNKWSRLVKKNKTSELRKIWDVVEMRAIVVRQSYQQFDEAGMRLKKTGSEPAHLDRDKLGLARIMPLPNFPLPLLQDSTQNRQTSFFCFVFRFSSSSSSSIVSASLLRPRFSVVIF